MCSKWYQFITYTSKQKHRRSIGTPVLYYIPLGGNREAASVDAASRLLYITS